MMTVISLAAAWLIRDDSLSENLGARKRRNLALMAAAFLALFYTFPAGMVLFWTVNTILQLLFDFTRQRCRKQGVMRKLTSVKDIDRPLRKQLGTVSAHWTESDATRRCARPCQTRARILPACSP